MCCSRAVDVVASIRSTCFHFSCTATATMAQVKTSNLKELLGLDPSSEHLLGYLKSLGAIVAQDVSDVPEVKSYPDAVYFNYFAFGLSLLFSPKEGYKPKTGLKRADLDDAKLVLDSIDVYNMPKIKRPGATASNKASRSAEAAFASYPVSPLILSLSGPSKDGKTRPDKLDVTPETTGKEFVECFGEPDRKGGGAGPSAGSIGIWCEWSKDGIMVEFGGDEARGPQAWEKGKDAVWKIITIFPPKI
ncbi:hypothetical protein PLICRDRAFT_405835 [Plicaturopsis crispa FD-325 SS-3]|nr:hypothetical protein PLICRDRAFT_405835 [Plicaturopsis crispa FD-325 SS-3]